jgi:hypothetical protein
VRNREEAHRNTVLSDTCIVYDEDPSTTMQMEEWGLSEVVVLKQPTLIAIFVLPLLAAFAGVNRSRFPS